MINRFIKILGVCAVCFAALLVWANWSAPSWTRNLPEHDFRIYRFSAMEVNEPDLNMQGVSATSWSETDKVLSVIFDPQKVSVDHIEKEIREKVGDFTIIENEYAGSACPVPHDDSWVQDLKSAFCFREPEQNVQ